MISNVKFVNNCNHVVYIKIKTINFSFSLPGGKNQTWYSLQPKSSQILNLQYTPGTQDVSAPRLISFDTHIIYSDKKRSADSRFNIGTNILPQDTPCISITYRPVIVENTGLMTIMILWLAALFFCLIGPTILFHDKEEKNSRTWAIIGLVCLFVSLGFSIFFIYAFVYVHGKRHNKTHENTHFNNFLCKSFGKNCISLTCK
jgi:hypothetical protein